MKKWCVVFFSLLVVPSLTYAQMGQNTDITVDRIVICEDVIDREPVAADSVFIGVERLCCFTEILGADEPTSVQHVWYRGEEEMGRIELNVGSPRWRTYSAKKLLSDWTGYWKVEILDAQGRKISEISFQIK